LSAYWKFIPKCIINALSDKPIRSVKTKCGVDICTGPLHSSYKDLFYGRTGEIYNISSGNEISDFDVAKKILGLVGKPDSAIEKADDSSLPTKRCILNSYKLKSNLNWSIKFKLEEGLRETILWYKQNPDRWKNVEL